MPAPFDATVTLSSLPLSATPAFGDERGGGIFVDLAGQVVRLRADGSRGVLDAHPQNAVAPGPASAVWPLGPYSALVATTKGLFFADQGWLIAPPWRGVLAADGVVATAVAESGVGWLAHQAGLFRIEDGELSELKLEGASVTGLTALSVGPTPDGKTGLWYAQGEALFAITQDTKTTFSVREGGLEKAELAGGVKALAGVSAGATTPGELWVITPSTLFQYTYAGWTRYELGRAPKQLQSSGRMAWLQAGDGLFRYDADARRWSEARGLPAVPTLLSVDAAGAAWVRFGEVAASVSPGQPPRLLGLYQDAYVYEPELEVIAALPLSSQPTKVSWTLDDGAPTEILASNSLPGPGPQASQLFFSLGGRTPTLATKPVSFAALNDGRHSINVTATFEDGSTTTRTMHFGLEAAVRAQLSFERDIKPINEARCTKCHATSTQPLLNTFQDWVDNADAIAVAVRDKRMPADGPLDEARSSAIQRWVNGGKNP